MIQFECPHGTESKPSKLNTMKDGDVLFSAPACVVDEEGGMYAARAGSMTFYFKKSVGLVPAPEDGMHTCILVIPSLSHSNVSQQCTRPTLRAFPSWQTI